MKFFQKELKLASCPRGFHLITSDILDAIPEIKHTSASLTINENTYFMVREDFESHFNYLVPENMPYFKHTLEGLDNMPAHIKA